LLLVQIAACKTSLTLKVSSSAMLESMMVGSLTNRNANVTDNATGTHTRIHDDGDGDDSDHSGDSVMMIMIDTDSTREIDAITLYTSVITYLRLSI
jgi:hypothetical protein